MVVRGSGPFAGWDLEDPADILKLIAALEYCLHAAPGTRDRSRLAVRRCNDTQYASAEVLAGMAHSSIDFRAAANVFVNTPEESTARLVRAAQGLFDAATQLAVPAPNRASSGPRNVCFHSFFFSFSSKC